MSPNKNLSDTSNTKFYHLNCPSKDKDNQLQKKIKKAFINVGWLS
jgi:hypothetical protein